MIMIMTKQDDMGTTETTATLRDSAREAVKAEVETAATYGHHRNHHKLHVRRDGRVTWFESINRSDDLIDERAEGFRAIPSVITTGTGSYACDCEYCNEVYDAATEALAADQGRKYNRDEKYGTVEEAIADAVSDSDLSELEDAMLDAFDAIPEGYFDDEE